MARGRLGSGGIGDEVSNGALEPRLRGDDDRSRCEIEIFDKVGKPLAFLYGAEI